MTNEIEEGKVFSEDIFSRLNIGKIGLTNAELLKALFLHRIDKEAELLNNSASIAKDAIEAKKLRLAFDWDKIESELQKDSFWAFIHGSNKVDYDTKIEFLFDLIQNKDKKCENEFWTFDKYIAYFKEFDENRIKNNSVDEKWKELTNIFYKLQDWYEDKALYHLIGYLRYKDFGINEILKIHENEKTNSDWTKELRLLCVKKAICKTNEKEFEDSQENENIKNFICDKLESFNYWDNSDKIRDVLLLSNVLEMLDCKERNVRFFFNDYYKTSYDIEHIRSQTPKNQDSKGMDRTDWILANLQYFSGIDWTFSDEDSARKNKLNQYKKDIKNKIDELKNNGKIAFYKIEGEKVNTVYAHDICEQLLDLFDNGAEISETQIYKTLTDFFLNEKNAPLEEVNALGNLVLLDSATNRGYKNAFFPIKRQWINKRAKDGIYIMPLTKCVFEKSFSTQLFDLMNWSSEDANAYLSEIEKCLTNL